MAAFFGWLFGGSSTAGGAAGGASAAGGATAGGTAAGSAAGATTGAASGGYSASQLISGAVQAFGALATMRAGDIDSAAQEHEAVLEDVRGKAAHVRGLQEGNEARERLLRTLASNNAAASVSGISVASQSIEHAGDIAALDAERQLSVIRLNAGMDTMGSKINAGRLRLGARSSQARGRIQAGTGLLSAYGTATKRGRA